MTFSDRLIDVTFEQCAYERLLSSVKSGGTLSAAHFLAALDGESEETLEEAFRHLRERKIVPDISDLPSYPADSEAAVRLRWEEQLSRQGDFLQKLDSSDPLRLYMEELSGIPVCGDIRVLAQELKQANLAGSEESPIRAMVMDLCLSRVVELARTYAGKGVLLMDLIQEGSMGLWEEISGYTGGDFEEFRDDWIHWYMTKTVVLQAHAAGMGQKLRRAVEDYRSVDEKLLTELGRNPTVEEIAEGLHLSVQETAVVAQILNTARTLQRAKKPEPEEIPQEEDQTVEDTAYFQMRQRITDLLSGLTERDARLLTLRYGLEGSSPMDPQQVGKRLGMTPEEVVSREAEALTKLRQQN